MLVSWQAADTAPAGFGEAGFCRFVVSFVVLSIGVLAYEKTWTASHYVSIHLHGKRRMCSQETVYTAFLFVTQDIISLCL